jgi:hypothetical protein
MPSAPAGRLEVVHVATPPLSGWAVHVPIAFPPSSNATVPDGLAPVTVAVNVTDCPTSEGLCDELTTIAGPGVIVTDGGSTVSVEIVAFAGP